MIEALEVMVTFDALEAALQGKIGTIRSIDVNHSRRIINIVYDDADGRASEGSTLKQDHPITSQDIVRSAVQ